MKIFIMTDMEGVAGVLDHDTWVTPQGRYYEAGKRLLTLEVNAAIDGFFAAGADEVLVADGHGFGGINIELLDRRAQFQRGFVGPHPFGCDKTFDAIAWIGQHPKAGTPYGHICHTGWFDVLDVTLNDLSVGEFGEDLLTAAELGVAPIFGSGCEAFCREANALAPSMNTVPVKRGLEPSQGEELDSEHYRSHFLSAVHLQPETARERIRVGAEHALRRYRENPQRFLVPAPKAPYTLRVSYRDGENGPAHVYTGTHPTSIIELLNDQYR